MSAEEPVPPEDWATDLVLVELRRAYPSPVSKSELEERCGVGPGALRKVIMALDEEGALAQGAVDGEAGWRYLEVEERAVGPEPISADEAPETAATPPEAVEAPESSPEQPLAEHPGTAGHGPPLHLPEDGPPRFVATFVTEVSYYPELEDEETYDQAALREAKDFLPLIAESIPDVYPDLPASANLLRVVAYDNPREIFPPT